MKFPKVIVVAFVFIVLLVRIIDVMTNIVPGKFLFDSFYYIALAERGFHSDALVSPFVYRYATPLISGFLHNLTGISIYNSFKLIAYLGGMAQLMGVFVLVLWLTGSTKSAFTGIAVVAFSLFNLKYLLFDVYRADHLAYFIIVLCTFFAFQNTFIPLLVGTMIGAQFREFTVLPLLAYLAVRIQNEGIKPPLKQICISAAGLLLALGLPRMLIPVTQDIQAVQFSSNGIAEAVSMVSDPKRMLNIVFIIPAYLLPSILLFRRNQFQRIKEWLDRDKRLYLLYYSTFVILLLILGGKDLDRFATYLFLPQAIFVGFQVRDEPIMKILAMLSVQFVFNRIWLNFPVTDYDRFVNFYGGFSNVVNFSSLMRFAELACYAVLGGLLLRALYKPNS